MGPGKLFGSDVRANAWSPRWATGWPFGSVSCSCNAAPQSAVRKRALPVASSPLTKQRRIWLVFAEQINIFQVKAWLSTFKARNANLKLLDNRRKKKKETFSEYAELSCASSVTKSSLTQLDMSNECMELWAKSRCTQSVFHLGEVIGARGRGHFILTTAKRNRSKPGSFLLEKGQQRKETGAT